MEHKLDGLSDSEAEQQINDWLENGLPNSESGGTVFTKGDAAYLMGYKGLAGVNSNKTSSVNNSSNDDDDDRTKRTIRTSLPYNATR